METIAWDDKFNIGVEVVDKAHAKLFRIMNKLIEISKDSVTNQSTYKEGLKYLEAYTMTHFAQEEEYMRSIRYNGYGQHKRIHDNFRDKILISLRKDMELSGYSLVAVERFVKTLNNWLAEHIMREDQAIVGRDFGRRGYDLSSQIPIISRAVNRTMSDVFQLEAKLANGDYKGQNIGTGYYCRHFYDTEGGVRFQILLGVEEPLLLRGIERMPGVLKNELTEDDILTIFAQLFQNLKKIFRVEKEYELGKNSLLTREKFRRDFMKGYPCSLLYSTKLGYFIFCYRSWRIKSQKTETLKEKKD
ncbi:MAG: hemerythrin family protein [Lachnospiraceae bacterium]|nr:hemerythrin family protein [Lachnospiraceae bacterium]